MTRNDNGIHLQTILSFLNYSCNLFADDDAILKTLESDTFILNKKIFVYQFCCF